MNIDVYNQRKKHIETIFIEHDNSVERRIQLAKMRINKRKQEDLQKRKRHNKYVEVKFKQINKIQSERLLHTEKILQTTKTLAIVAVSMGAAIWGIHKYLEKLTVDFGESPELEGYSGDNTGHVSESLKKRLKEEEGLYLYTYDDKAGYDKNGKHPRVMPGDKVKGTLTIGYGHTGKDVVPGLTITKEEAERLFENDIKVAENKVKDALKRKGIKTKFSQNQFDAMVDYVYNAGHLGEKFLTKISTGDYQGAAKELEVGNQNLGRMASIRSLFLSDVTADNKLKSDAPSYTTNGGKITHTHQTDNGVSYTGMSNITSHDRLYKNYNATYYNPNANTGKDNYGTWNGVAITSGIGHRKVTVGSSFHKGLDLAYAPNTPVNIFCGGKVVYNGVMRGYGNIIVIEDSNGYRHVYGHLNKRYDLPKTYITVGTTIGLSGGTGTDAFGRLKFDAYAPHLHYGIWRPGYMSDSGYVDPRTYTFNSKDLRTNQLSKNVIVGKENVNNGNKSDSSSTKGNTVSKKPTDTVSKPNTENKQNTNIISSTPKQKTSSKNDIDINKLV